MSALALIGLAVGESHSGLIGGSGSRKGHRAGPGGAGFQHHGVGFGSDPDADPGEGR